MSILIFFLTVFLVLDCLFLGLLILVQLPKKEAGIGMAFGGGATDALFGAGSGNALTKLTKYSAVAFFCLVFILSILHIHARNSSTSAFTQEANKPSHGTTGAAPGPASPASAKPAVATNLSPAGTNLMGLVPTNITPAITNAVPATNPPAGKPK